MPAPDPSPSAPAAPTVSVVIPVLNDPESLARLIGLLRSGTAQPDEILVVDGSRDGSCGELCERLACHHLQTRPGRGHQLHAGARQSVGQVIWFLHADATPPAGGVGRIRGAAARGYVGGCFRFRFDGPPTWYKRALAAGVNLRTGFGIPYGDQGLFVTRTAYDRAGGFPDVPLFEEVPLVRRLRRLGPFARLDASIGVSPRRWERDGWIRRSLENRALALAYVLGVSPARLARRYRTDVSGRTRSGPETGPC